MEMVRWSMRMDRFTKVSGSKIRLKVGLILGIIMGMFMKEIFLRVRSKEMAR